MKNTLKSIAGFTPSRGPVVLLIMDGVGCGAQEEGDMVQAARKPNLDWLRTHALYSRLKAHGEAVGLPSDEDMGNSEVGHNAIGCGRVFAQGARLVNDAIQSGRLFEGSAWQDIMARCQKEPSTLHFIGLLSDGNVHSHIEQLNDLLRGAVRDGVKRLRVHTLLDGRDVPPTSALEYVRPLEALLSSFRDQGYDARIASGGGRMRITMDRYGADWSMVARGWTTHVKGEGRMFATAEEAITTLRQEHPNVGDQDLPPFVIAHEGQPVGPIQDGDSVIFFNFRGDRSIEISRAFEEDDFSAFDRGPRPDVLYTGMMQYDGDLHIPKRYLVEPPAIDRTLDEYLVRSGVRQLAVSETQKFGHVTYFFNGNQSGKFDEVLDDYLEIPSDVVPFDQRPWMKSAEITDVVVQAIRAGEHRFIRLNYPNGDMVGHTGMPIATRMAVEAVDLGLGRVMEAIRETGGVLVVSADHGNADDMYERDRKTGNVAVDPQTGQPKTKTSHSLNPVPVMIYDPEGRTKARLSAAKDLGIASLAATCLRLLGFEPPEDYAPAVVDVGDPS